MLVDGNERARRDALQLILLVIGSGDRYG